MRRFHDKRRAIEPSKCGLIYVDHASSNLYMGSLSIQLTNISSPSFGPFLSSLVGWSLFRYTIAS